MTPDPEDRMPEESAPETDAWAGLGHAWRGGYGDDVPAVISTTVIAHRAGRFARTIAWRNAGEFGASAVLLVVAVKHALGSQSLVNMLPSLAMIVAVVWVVAQLVMRGRNLSPPSPAATTDQFLAHELAQLERQRQLLLGVRRWYLAPIAVPVTLSLALSLVRTIQRHHASAKSIAVWLVAVAIVVVVFVAVDRLNARAARKLGERLRALGR